LRDGQGRLLQQVWTSGRGSRDGAQWPVVLGFDASKSASRNASKPYRLGVKLSCAKSAGVILDITQDAFYFQGIGDDLDG